MSGPLSGVRIIDMTSNFMGPYATLLLADMGADVIKVESPVGDTTRGVGPRRHVGMSAIFLHLNRNKRSIVIDLKDPEGLATLRRLIPGADAVVYSLRPQAMRKLGLSYEQMSEVNPSIVYTGAFGFGQKGPYADRPAYDDLIQAGVGMPVLQSRRQGEPQYMASAVADRVVGMALSNATLAALLEREHSGLGQEVQVPMLETFAHFIQGDHLYGHTFVPSQGRAGYERMMNPARRPYPTKDGYITIMAYSDKHWHSFFELAGRPDMAEDPRFKDIAGRTENIGLLYEFMGSFFADMTTSEAVGMLNRADIPGIEVSDPDRIWENEHFAAVDFFPEIDHPTEGRLRSIGIPHAWSRTEPDIRLHAPLLGENTAEVLKENGFTESEIDRLLDMGAVRCPAQAEP
ncbi:CaiB/BaiF CoA transferase family protein [Brevibacterium sp. VCM10]|uniref:CaiB/BaiF CoA transferase family protein n=1 Tax=Brevibacterium sp. VCM10 TaxID=1381751 RepID=UPI000471B848|nr:CoA transferase [Brevibacterium sp. VCM10]